VNQNTPNLLPRKAVELKTGFKKSSIFAKIKAGTFPGPIRVDGAGYRWISTEVDEWITNQIRDSRAGDSRED
jgi:prophage regulatory protein